MFRGWFKRTIRREPLDLARHKPAEFEGKSVTLDGRQFVVDRLFRRSNQGHAHLLVDPKSGLCQHIIQIRIEYMQAPGTALTASLEKAKLTALLKEKMGPSAPTIPVITVRREHGGSFELHTFSRPLKPNITVKSASSSLSRLTVPSVGIAPTLSSDDPDVEGRSDFYVRVYQHHALREAAFQMHPELLKGFNSGESLQLEIALRHIWFKVPLKLGVKTSIRTADEYIKAIGYNRRNVGNFTVHVLSMPKPLHETESLYVAIAWRNGEPPAYPRYSGSTRYFTLELVRGENCAFCEWTIERHMNRGALRDASLESFVNAVTECLCSEMGDVTRPPV